jgi:hypothetical protein
LRAITVRAAASMAACVRLPRWVGNSAGRLGRLLDSAAIDTAANLPWTKLKLMLDSDSDLG